MRRIEDLRNSAICEWQEPDVMSEGIWETDCGNAHEFFVDGPVENGYKFCPYCGRRIVVVFDDERGDAMERRQGCSAQSRAESSTVEGGN